MPVLNGWENFYVIVDQPVFEDWIFHVLLPLAAYSVLGLSAYAAQEIPGESPNKNGMF